MISCPICGSRVLHMTMRKPGKSVGRCALEERVAKASSSPRRPFTGPTTIIDVGVILTDQVK